MLYIRIEALKIENKGEVVLKDVNFEIREGELLSISGPLGCGKSTLSRILIDL